MGCTVLWLFIYTYHTKHFWNLWSQTRYGSLVQEANSYLSNSFINTGLPWWCSGWESACQCRGHGFEPWSGRIPHAVERLGPWATTTEPVRLEPVLRNKRGRNSERPAHPDEEWPPLAASGESPRTEKRRPNTAKSK